MRLNYRKLGEYIRQIDIRNKDLKVSRLLGVSISKSFIESIANTIGTDFSNYKIVYKRQFAYGPVTSRNGEKISVALLEEDACIISSSYIVFEVVDVEKLLPEYLMLWFSRPEFDRYARYKSHGSVREIFDWNELCDACLPVPTVEEQKKIVAAYQVVEDRIKLKRKINDNLEATLVTIFAERFSLSKGSQLIPLSELITFGNGKARPKSEGAFPVYGGNGVLSYTNQYNAENVVLIGRVGAYCGSVYIEESQCWVSDNAIFAKSRVSDAEYFDYVLLKSLNLYDHHIGTGQQLLTQAILNKIEVPETNKAAVDSFNTLCKGVFSSITNTNNEIIQLKILQSFLLAKLSA